MPQTGDRSERRVTHLERFGSIKKGGGRCSLRGRYNKGGGMAHSPNLQEGRR